MIKKFLDILLGEALPNERSSHEKYNVPFGLAVMASDAISSVAYASQEILLALLFIIGSTAYNWLSYVTLMIIGLLVILTVSYIQIIRAYPQGGGAYIVAKENIGVKPGLIAAAALLVDYVLTVAVSASAAVAAITSAFTNLQQYTVLIVVVVIIILTILNLRGVSESAKIFSLPTYLFIFSMIFMILYGFVRTIIFHVPPSVPADMPHKMVPMASSITLYLILKAFANGCSALTGLEAVSNSVPNFKEPSQKNAITVMISLGCLIFVIFGGTSILARLYQAIPSDKYTVLSQIAYGVFHNSGLDFMFYVIQITTAIILFMACNTSFTGFPMLTYVLGRDGYAPRQFTNRGKRLSFSTGIIFLSIIACILVIAFHANTDSLIPLYSVGVFISFTLAQIGMVIHWRKGREKGWINRAIINGFGSILTLITTCVITYEKFMEGAWIVVLVIPILVFIMMSIKKHYNVVADRLRVAREDIDTVLLGKKFDHVVVVPIASLNKAALNALQYARSISSDVIALNISTDLESMEKLKAKWEDLNTDILLVTKYSKYRAVVTPLIGYINQIAQAASQNEKITVLLPQFITDQWWGEILHNHTSFLLREALLNSNTNLIVSIYPYHLHSKNDKKI